MNSCSSLKKLKVGKVNFLIYGKLLDGFFSLILICFKTCIWGFLEMQIKNFCRSLIIDYVKLVISNWKFNLLPTDRFSFWIVPTKKVLHVNGIGKYWKMTRKIEYLDAELWKFIENKMYRAQNVLWEWFFEGSWSKDTIIAL